MIVDLLNVGDRPIQFDFQIEPDKVDLDSETVRILSKVNVSGELRRNPATLVEARARLAWQAIPGTLGPHAVYRKRADRFSHRPGLDRAL